MRMQKSTLHDYQYENVVWIKNNEREKNKK